MCVCVFINKQSWIDTCAGVWLCVISLPLIAVICRPRGVEDRRLQRSTSATLGTSNDGEYPVRYTNSNIHK